MISVKAMMTNHFMATDSSPSRWGRRSRLLAIVAMTLVCALTLSLARWQWLRGEEKAQRQALLDRADPRAAVSIGRDRLDAAALAGHSVVLEGRFQPEKTIFIDNRTHRGVAGFHVMTPVTIPGSEWQVMVLRGWVAANPRERTRLPEIRTPDGPVRVSGTVEPDLGRALELKASSPPGPGDRLWQNFDAARYEAWAGVRLQAFVVRQSAGTAVDDGLVREWRSVAGDVDKHRGYAVQWLAMALASAVVIVVLALGLRRGDRPH